MDAGPGWTCTTDLALISLAWLGFTTTYKTAGTAKIRGSHTRHRLLWVGLWVGKSAETPKQPHKCREFAIAYAIRGDLKTVFCRRDHAAHTKEPLEPDQIVR